MGFQVLPLQTHLRLSTPMWISSVGVGGPAYQPVNVWVGMRMESQVRLWPLSLVGLNIILEIVKVYTRLPLRTISVHCSHLYPGLWFCISPFLFLASLSFSERDWAGVQVGMLIDQKHLSLKSRMCLLIRILWTMRKWGCLIYPIASLF